MTTDPQQQQAGQDAAGRHVCGFCGDSIGIDSLAYHINRFHRVMPDRYAALVGWFAEANRQLQAAEQRADALAVSLAETREAFVKHRTTTHEVAPAFCTTCRESDAILAADPDQRGRAILAVVVAAQSYEARLDDERAVFDSDEQGWPERMFAAYKARQDAGEALSAALRALGGAADGGAG